MEYGSIEREIHVEASPDIVFEVISSPVHLTVWRPTRPRSIRPRRRRPARVRDRRRPPGARRGDHHRGHGATWAVLVPLGLPRGRGRDPVERTAGDGRAHAVRRRHRVRITETGYREKGWEVAVLEETYNDHVSGSDAVIPSLGEYVARLVSAT